MPRVLGPITARRVRETAEGGPKAVAELHSRARGRGSPVFELLSISVMG